MIDFYEKEYPDIFNVIRSPQNVGLGAALRYGVPIWKNEIIARMDDDDIARSKRCEQELAYLKSNSEYVLVVRI